MYSKCWKISIRMHYCSSFLLFLKVNLLYSTVLSCRRDGMELYEGWGSRRFFSNGSLALKSTRGRGSLVKWEFGGEGGLGAH